MAKKQDPSAGLPDHVRAAFEEGGTVLVNRQLCRDADEYREATGEQKPADADKKD